MNPLTLTLAFLILPAFTYLFGRFDRRASYFKGYRDGRNEERAHTNSKMIPAKLDACRKGREAERNRAALEAHN